VKFPDWLPPAVAREARWLLDNPEADHVLIKRLTTDGRMQSKKLPTVIVRRRRSKDNLRARTFILNVATLTDKPMLGTLATLASVALEADVDKSQVREWLMGGVKRTHKIS
jgi:hypothetical protein